LSAVRGIIKAAFKYSRAQGVDSCVADRVIVGCVKAAATART
jgi:hypothetical protein